MMVFAFTLHNLSPILTIVMEDLAMTHSQAGMLMTFLAVPGIVLALAAGILSDRFGPFRIGVMSLVITLVGTLLLAVSDSFFLAAVSRVIAGLGISAISVVSAQFLSQWFRDDSEGTAMGIFNIVVPLGTIICFSTFGSMAQTWNWSIPVYISASFCFLVLLLFVILYRHPPVGSSTASLPKKQRGGRVGSRETQGTGGNREGINSIKRILRIGFPIWILGLCWMWYTAATIAFSTFAPDFFVSEGYSISYSGFLSSILMWCSLIIAPLVGRWLDRIGNNDLFIAGGGSLVALGIFLITLSDAYIPILLCIALGMALVPTPTFAFPSRIVAKEKLGQAFGILTMFISLGMLFGPYLTGLIRDRSGGYSDSFRFLALLSVLIPINAFLLRFYLSRQKAEGGMSNEKSRP